MWFKLFSCILHVCLFMRPCAGYNLEVNKVGVATGEPGSQFGYTVVFVNDRDPNLGIVPDKILLAGCPNLTVDGIRAHGDVFKCNGSDTNQPRCVPMNMKDPGNVCARLRRNKATQSHCEEDSRMGATMALNRKYFNSVYKEDATVPMVTMCAPGWTNVLHEDNLVYEKYIFGMCLKVDHNLNTLDCPVNQSHRGYCWPFWGGNIEGQTTARNGRAVFAYAVGGFSAAFTNDGLSEIIGAPGVNHNRGAFKAYEKSWFGTKDWSTNSTIYLGYSLATGVFKNGANLLISSPNFYTSAYGHRGRVEMREGETVIDQIEFGNRSSACEFSNGTNDEIVTALRGVKFQVGTKFGAALAAIDIDGDGFDEVFIGAPLYSDNHVEEGKVFVYRSSESLCVLGILSGSANVPSLEGQTSYGRFGTSISTAGDLDADDYNDVAIGAPYEDDGRGVVYIYNGLFDRPLADMYSQRIQGRELDSGLRGFGFSIFGGDGDVDHNGFPDLAIGAYASDQAVILRARPVAIVATADLDLHPMPIPLIASGLGCSNGTDLCFNLSLSLTHIGRGKDNGPINVRCYLNADTIYKKKENGTSRVVFRDNLNSELNDTVIIERGESKPLSYIINVLPGDNGRPEPRDPWTTMQISGYYELVPSAGPDFNMLDHILSPTYSHTFSVEVYLPYFPIERGSSATTNAYRRISIKKCDNIAECTSDLDLNVELHLLGRGQSEKVNSSTVIYVDGKYQMQMVMEVTNTLNVSYKTNVSAEVQAALRRTVTQDGTINAHCKYDLYRLPCRMNCTAQEELGENEAIRVKTNFDISRARLVPEPKTLENMQRSVNISVVANQGNTDEDPSNNVFSISIPVMIKSEIDIIADTETFSRVRYNADPKSTRGILIKHIFYVTNNGPSFLPKTFVNISIPYKKGGSPFASIKSGSSLCIEQGEQSQVTTEPPITVTVKDYDIDDPDSQRKRREAMSDATGSVGSSGKTTGTTWSTKSSDETTTTTVSTKPSGETTERTSNVRNITCEDEYECAVFECELSEMERADSKTLDFTITVDDTELSRGKGVRIVRYVTKAVATPPSVWFSGKVVPWDNPVEEYKTTTFIVEPDSVVTKVNIGIIIGSVLGALALLAIFVVVLWKCGFFRRKKRDQMKRMRQESLHKRRSQMRPTSTLSTTRATPPHNEIENADEKS